LREIVLVLDLCCCQAGREFRGSKLQQISAYGSASRRLLGSRKGSLLRLKAHDDLTVLNTNRLETRKESVTFRQTRAYSLFQSLLNRISISLSCEQPREPVAIPLDIETIYFQFVLLNSKSSGNFAIEEAVPQ